MSAIYDLKMWKEIARRSTSGDQVWDILASWESNEAALTARNEALTSKLARMEAAERWIPVSERLPEDKGEYLCYSKPDIFTCFFGDSWNGTDAFRSVIEPTHWRPLPQPPEEQE